MLRKTLPQQHLHRNGYKDPLPSVRLVVMRTRPSQLRVVPGTVIAAIVLASLANRDPPFP